VIHGEKDTDSVSHGKELYNESSRGQTLHIIPGAGHNNLFAGIDGKIKQFVETHLPD
jgi:hypothetical protein